MSLIEHQASTPATQAAPKQQKPRRISKRMQQALACLATKGMTQRDAAAKAGISEFHLSRELKKPQIQAFIAQKAAENIQRGVLRASVRLAELIDAESEHVAAKVSDRILEHAGILKSQSGGISVNVNNNLAVGYVVDLSPMPRHAVNAPLTQDAPQDADK